MTHADVRQVLAGTLAFAMLFAEPTAHADLAATPASPDALGAAITTRIAGGVFPVFDAPGVTLVVLGEAPNEWAAGPRSMLGTTPGEQEPWIASAPIADGSAPGVVAVEGRPVRVVGRAGSCDATLGRPVLVRAMKRMTFAWARSLHGRSERPRDAELPDAVWGMEEPTTFAAAPLVGRCRGGVVATTTLAAPAVVVADARRDDARRAEYTRLYRDTPESRSLAYARSRLPPDWPRPQVKVRRFPDGATREIALVNASLEDDCISGTDYPVLFVRDAEQTRRVRTPFAHLEGVFDVDGDGQLELVFTSGQWTRTVVRLRPDSSDVETVGAFFVASNMGC